jgi:diacylglycerol O-acyltransferase
MPVSTRHDRSAGGNAFSPTQTLVPTGEMAITERFELIHHALTAVKTERVIDALEGAANAAAMLPSAALVRTGQHLAGSVDFVCSNVRAAPFDLFIGGAFMEANYPLGPLAGTAFNLTTMSYRGWLFLGLVTDPAAVQHPEELLSELDAAYAALLSAGGVRRPQRY